MPRRDGFGARRPRHRPEIVGEEVDVAAVRDPPKAAQRILEFRQKNGNFKKIEDLMNVKGIGEKNFLKLKPYITVGTQKADASAGK